MLHEPLRTIWGERGNERERTEDARSRSELKEAFMLHRGRAANVTIWGERGNERERTEDARSRSELKEAFMLHK